MRILAKAQLAQALLERTFNQSVATGVPLKAWSWVDTWPVARIDTIRQQAGAIVLSGSSGEALSFGPALLNETARPGQRGMAAIAGHRDTHFNFRKEVVAGNLVTVTRDDGVPFIYRVTGIAIVD